MKMGALFGGVFALVWIALIVVILVGMYKTFARMGYDDAWWIFIPILNIIFVLKVIEKPLWWIVLMLIPCVSAIVGLYCGWLLSDKVAKAYGKDTLFAVGLLLLGFIFYPILGFGSAEPQQKA
jgi:hypothetical protein